MRVGRRCGPVGAFACVMPRLRARARAFAQGADGHARARVQLYRHEFVKPSCPFIVVPVFAEVADGTMKLGFLQLAGASCSIAFDWAGALHAETHAFLKLLQSRSHYCLASDNPVQRLSPVRRGLEIYELAIVSVLAYGGHANSRAGTRREIPEHFNRFP